MHLTLTIFAGIVRMSVSGVPQYADDLMFGQDVTVIEGQQK